MSDTPVPAPNAVEPILSPVPTALSTNQQAGSGASANPNSNAKLEPTFVDAAMENGEVPEQPLAPARKVDPMQGMKLETILHELVAYFGWDEMGYRINIRCFNEDPSIGSSLKFLRKTPWARNKVDALFLTMRAEQTEQAEQVERVE